MKVKLTHAAHLSGKDYAKGIHDIPDAHLKSKFALKLIKAGHIVEHVEEIKGLTQAQRQKQLVDTLQNAPFKVTLPKATEAPKVTALKNAPEQDSEEETQDWEPQGMSDEERQTLEDAEEFLEEVKEKKKAKKPKESKKKKRG